MLRVVVSGLLQGAVAPSGVAIRQNAAPRLCARAGILLRRRKVSRAEGATSARTAGADTGGTADTAVRALLKLAGLHCY